MKTRQPAPTGVDAATRDPLGFLRDAQAVRALADALGSGRRVTATGAAGSSTSLVCAAAAALAQRPLVLVVAHLDEADDAADELAAFGVAARRLPAMEMLPGEAAASLDTFGERLRIARALREDGMAPGEVLVCPVQALMQALPPESRLADLSLRLRTAQTIAPGQIVRWLDAAGYKRVDAIEEPGDFAVRGGIIDVFPAGGSAPPVRLDFFGDDIDAIVEIDMASMGSDQRMDAVEIVGATAGGAAAAGDDGVQLASLLPAGVLVAVQETAEVYEQARGYFERVREPRGVFGPPATLKALQNAAHGFAEVNQFSGVAAASDVVVQLPVEPLPALPNVVAEGVAELAAMADRIAVEVFCQNEGELSRLGELLDEFAPGSSIRRTHAYLHRGFVWRSEGDERALVPYHELLHRYQARRRVRGIKAGRAMDAFLDLREGDAVVHADHGVARFLGLRSMKPKRGASGGGPKTEEEFLTLEFAGGSKLHVPVSQIDKVQKYVGGFKGSPPLSTLGGRRWKRQKEQAAEATRDMAAEMLRVQAARESQPGVRYPADTAWQKEFEAEFPYDETEDQLAALAEIKKDMQSPRPMDRLLCGDVGYGKTELAVRAAFKAVEYGKQVAVLVPTTVLAEQHERTFRERLAGYPFTVESLSRFKTAKEQKETLTRLAKGQVDIIIGTHRLLSRDVRFADLGVVVVDEEQRFGVEDKQKLLSLRMMVDVLTLSATPIPRTLHMSLLGLRDISSLATPPSDRRSVVTEVAPWNETRLARAIERELSREGQVFFVHNRVHNIQRIAGDVQRLAPGARIVIGHGQMPAGELEKVMLAFMRREADILVCTTIIESGIDIPTANTMIINDADRFGLADLHQLRGRVGRYKHRAYCYLVLPTARTITDTARRRLRAVEEFSMLGAGFKIAMRDLEIRGAGNLLGAEQSGHIAAVGYEMYCRLLDDAVKSMRHEAPAASPQTSVEIGVAGMLPKAYIPSDARRMEAYRRIGLATTFDDLDRVRTDLTNAYGDPPRAAERLLDLAAVRIGAQALTIRSISVRAPDVIFRCEHPEDVAASLEGAGGTVRILSARSPTELREVYFRPPAAYLEPETLLTVLRRRLGEADDACAPEAARVE